MQIAFVICRLFYKPDEKTPISKTDKVDEKNGSFIYDEVDPSGLSPAKSSPGSQHSGDDNGRPSQVSVLIQESHRKPEVSSPTADDNEQNADIDSWLDDGSHNRTLYPPIAEECLSNSNVISDVEDHKANAATTEVNKLTVILIIYDDKLSVI